MSTDRRELILARLHEVLEGIDEAVKAFRDRNAVPENMRPAWLLLDADEEARTPEVSRPNRVLQPSAPITMKPEIYYMVKPRANPPPAGTPASGDEDDRLTVGKELNAVRLQAVKAILEDAQLLDLVGGAQGGGRIQYVGCATDMKDGQLMLGLLQLHIEFDYPMLASEL